MQFPLHLIGILLFFILLVTSIELVISSVDKCSSSNRSSPTRERFLVKVMNPPSKSIQPLKRIRTSRKRHHTRQQHSPSARLRALSSVENTTDYLLAIVNNDGTNKNKHRLGFMKRATDHTMGGRRQALTARSSHNDDERTPTTTFSKIWSFMVMVNACSVGIVFVRNMLRLSRIAGRRYKSWRRWHQEEDVRRRRHHHQNDHSLVGSNWYPVVVVVKPWCSVLAPWLLHCGNEVVGDDQDSLSESSSIELASAVGYGSFASLHQDDHYKYDL